MEFIVKQTQYLSKTMDYFKDFIKETTLNTNFSIIESIKKAISFMEPSLKDIHIITNLEKDMDILGYENEFIQSLINVIDNSKDAILNKKKE